VQGVIPFEDFAVQSIQPTAEVLVVFSLFSAEFVQLPEYSYADPAYHGADQEKQASDYCY
jgi:hypothetical protein